MGIEKNEIVERDKLLNEIARCSYVNFCIQNSSEAHPCKVVVDSQGVTELDKYQLPEPWNGHIIETAPILFISSNPSINFDEDYPCGSWSNDDINDFFNNRFGGGKKEWIKDGNKTLLKDGSYSDGVNFLSSIRLRAMELLQRDVNPGIDYALTEVVHCKSINEIGIKQAKTLCAETYLRKVVEMATSASVIVILGVIAKEAMQKEFSIPNDVSIFSLNRTIGKNKFVTFLPHPNARMPRTFAKCLKSEELEKLRTILQSCK